MEQRKGPWTTHPMRDKKLVCPGCGCEIWGVSNIQDVKKPRPGDPMVCDKCSCVHTIDASGQLVGFTADQALELERMFAAYPKQKELLLKVVGVVRLVRARSN